jgi:hypothetical protein
MSLFIDGFIHAKNFGLPADRILVGILRSETKPGVYRFEGYSSEGTFAVDDAHILRPDADLHDGGMHAKPQLPAACVAATGPGSSVWILGFAHAPTANEKTNDAPTVGDVSDNNVAGDKVYRTSGGAQILLKRGGAVLLQGGALATITLNPIGDQVSIQSANMAATADGYSATRGRKIMDSTQPETQATTDFHDRVGPATTRVRIRHGTFDSDARRQLTVSRIRQANGTVTGTVLSRETYRDDGSWIGEGPKYQWGGAGADEPHVLGNQLKDVLNDILDAIDGLQVNTAWGPSTTPLPPTIQKTAGIRDQLNNGKIASRFMFLTKDPAELGSVNE